MTTLYIIRHGETDRNIEKRIQGSTDIPLNDTGKNQASMLGKYFADIHIDHIYSSDLSRAYHTAQSLCGSKSIPISTDIRLREQSSGQFEGWLRDDVKEYCEINKITMEDAFDQDAIQDLHQRIKSFLDEIIANHNNQTIVITTHGGRKLQMFKKIFNIDRQKTHNTSVSKIIAIHESLYIEYINKTDHLSEQCID